MLRSCQYLHICFSLLPLVAFGPLQLKPLIEKAANEWTQDSNVCPAKTSKPSRKLLKGHRKDTSLVLRSSAPALSYNSICMPSHTSCLSFIFRCGCQQVLLDLHWNLFLPFWCFLSQQGKLAKARNCTFGKLALSRSKIMLEPVWFYFYHSVNICLPSDQTPCTPPLTLGNTRK